MLVFGHHADHRLICICQSDEYYVRVVCIGVWTHKHVRSLANIIVNLFCLLLIIYCYYIYWYDFKQSWECFQLFIDAWIYKKFLANWHIINIHTHIYTYSYQRVYVCIFMGIKDAFVFTFNRYANICTVIHTVYSVYTLVRLRTGCNT